MSEPYQAQAAASDDRAGLGPTAGPLARLATRWRSLGLIWLIVLPLVGLTLMTLLMQTLGIVSWDAPAHLYKVALVRQYNSVFWDNNWYGGAYQIVSYGFVFYWLARFVSYNALVIASTGLMPVFFFLYMRKVYGSRSYWPSIALAAVLIAYMSNGQDPFLFAMSLTMGAMVLVAYGRPGLAAIPAGLSLFANPVGLVIGGVFLLADFVARPGTRRRYVTFGLWLLPFLIARALMALLFYEKATYVYPLAEVIHFAGFGVVGFVMARASLDRERGPKQVLYLTFAGVAVLFALVPHNPVGWNIGRFFFLFGVPLLLDIRKSYLPKLLVVPLIIGASFGQLGSPVSHYFRVAEMPSTHQAFFSPALDFAGMHYDPNYRFHVVALDTHWEAYYFSINGFPITRGWYRQADAVHNQLFANNDFTTGQYIDWLRSMAVQYVFLPKAPLDWSGPREAQILAASPEFSKVFDDSEWTVYRLVDPMPMVVSLDHGKQATVLALRGQSVFMAVPAAGRYLIHITYSPYWELDTGQGTLSKGSGDFVQLAADKPGYYDIRVKVTVDASLRELIRVF